jgi:hypothetical protein
MVPVGKNENSAARNAAYEGEPIHDGATFSFTVIDESDE